MKAKWHIYNRKTHRTNINANMGWKGPFCKHGVGTNQIYFAKCNVNLVSYHFDIDCVQQLTREFICLAHITSTIISINRKSKETAQIVSIWSHWNKTSEILFNIPVEGITALLWIHCQSGILNYIIDLFGCWPDNLENQKSELNKHAGHIAHTSVSWTNHKQWLTVQTSDLMVKIITWIWYGLLTQAPGTSVIKI